MYIFIYLYLSFAWITPKDENKEQPCIPWILIAPNLKVFNFSLVESQIGSYVRWENTLILHKNTLVFLKFDESMRRMRVQDTYFLFIFQREHRVILMCLFGTHFVP